MLPSFHTTDRGDHFRLQAMDRSMIGGPALYLACGHGASAAPARQDLVLAPDEWLGGGTFRNSFYVEPWARLSRVRDLSLVVEAEGSLRLRVMQAAPGRAAQVLREQAFSAATRQRVVLPLGSPLDMPAAARLFWHVDAVDGGQLHEAAWCTRTPVRAAGKPGADPARMAVLLRTHGRADDVRALLQRLADAAAADPFHASVLARLDFNVLDASPAEDPAWQDMAALGLNLTVRAGANLGGGGNAALLAKLFLDEQATREHETAEVLILDDDLSLSMETLARYFVFCGYRASDVICSLPVLMKSRPATVWEDGGLWGRGGLRDALPAPAGEQEAAPRRGFGPQLKRHGISVEGYEHLDAFGPLEEIEYATFIFFGLPTRALRRLGYPAALFLRGDDIEFSLRARRLGLPLFSNPNLAAWHEPGHSYAQEHMAVLHGALINLSYSSNTASDYGSFFEQRMAEHAALDDAEGMSLYLKILEELLDPASQVLTPDFPAHYQAAMARLGAIRMGPFPDAERERAQQRAPESGELVLPFIYPGYHPPASGTRIAPSAAPRPVLLFNHGAQTGRLVQPAKPENRMALQRRMLEALSRWHAGFPALQTHWQDRLARTGTAAFWQEVQQRPQNATREIFSSRSRQTPSMDHRHHGAAAEREGAGMHDLNNAPDTRGAREEAGHAASARGHRPIHELRDRLERELARWTQMRLSAERSQRPVSGGRGRSRAWWRPFWSKAAAPPPVVALPADFDAAAYLALNADVARSGVDAAQHYLSFGRSEGRRYRL